MAPFQRRPPNQRRRVDASLRFLQTSPNECIPCTSWPARPRYIEGALTYLRDGLVTPAEVKAATQEYRDEMDKVGPFIAACVEPADNEHVKARTMYQAYESWALANGEKPVFETRFGKEAKKKLAHGEVGKAKQAEEARW